MFSNTGFEERGGELREFMLFFIPTGACFESFDMSLFKRFYYKSVLVIFPVVVWIFESPVALSSGSFYRPGWG